MCWSGPSTGEPVPGDLRIQALNKGALIFSRGEGMWFGSADEVGEASIYFACTERMG